MLNIGVDIGGANTKFFVFGPVSGGDGGDSLVRCVGAEYLPLWEAKNELHGLLTRMLEAFLEEPHRMGVTMTAELADCFPSKAEGVTFVLSAIRKIAPSARVLSCSGRFLALDQATGAPEMVAAANWAAPPLLVSRLHPDALFIDVGSTTTDIIPIVDGVARVADPTDVGRLVNRNLVYTGALRTNVATLVERLLLGNQSVPISSEHFSTIADVNLVLGLIEADEYTVPTADGTGIDLKDARARLARVICSDPGSMSMEEAQAISEQIHKAQVSKVRDAIMTVMCREELGTDLPCVVAGVGRRALAEPSALDAGFSRIVAFHECLERGLKVRLGDHGESVTRHAPAAAIGLLLGMEESRCG